MMTLLLSLLAFAAYLFAALQLVFSRPQTSLAEPLPKQAAKPARNWYWYLGLLAMLLHATLLYLDLHTPEGVKLSFFNAASLIMWVMALLWVLSVRVKPVESLGLVLFPLAALSILLAALFPSHSTLHASLQFGTKLHILSSILAYSLLFLGAVQAVFLALQEKQLRRKHPGLVMRRLPPLQVMEQLLFQMLTGGFLLLTASLLSGAMFLEDIFAQHLVHKTILSMLAWGIFALLLWGRWRYGWRGRTAVRWTLIGFTVLMLAYFGSKLVLELILQRT